jgi:hypothetical protein
VFGSTDSIHRDPCSILGGIGITTTSMCTRFIFFLILSCANAANLFSFPTRRTSLIRSGEIAALLSSIESSSDNTPHFRDKSKQVPAVTSNYKAPPIDANIRGIELQMEVTTDIAGDRSDEEYGFDDDTYRLSDDGVTDDGVTDDGVTDDGVTDDGVDFWTELDDEKKPDFQGTHDSIVIGENLLFVHAPMDV